MCAARLALAVTSLALSAGCTTFDLKTDQMVAKEKITADLKVFALTNENQRTNLKSYDLTTHETTPIVSLGPDAVIQDLSEDLDKWLFTDTNGKRIVLFSVKDNKILFQRTFDKSDIGLARLSPDQKKLVLSWNSKIRANATDRLTILDSTNDAAKPVEIAKVTDRAVTELQWGTQGDIVVSATADPNDKEDNLWTSTELKSQSRRSLRGTPRNTQDPFFTREPEQCQDKYYAEAEGSSKVKRVISISKFEQYKDPIIKFKSGLTTSDEGNNFTLFNTPNCAVALLKVADVLYAIDVTGKTMAPIVSEFSGFALPVKR